MKKPALSAEAEVEITDDMLAAGVKAYSEWDRRFEEVEGLVIAIFEAMSRAKN